MSPLSFALIDGGGQLMIRLQLVRLVGETVGMIQLHQLLPKPRQLGFLLGGQLLLLVRRRRQFLVILVRLRFGLLVILLGLFRFFRRRRVSANPDTSSGNPQ